ncbi:MAG: hypothetical protein AB2653_13195, partial [Candidatus Thiodiazotropha endolucinida]
MKMVQKIALSVFIALGAIACFYCSIIGITEMLSGSTEVVTTVGKSGASSFHLWQILSLLAFIVG